MKNLTNLIPVGLAIFLAIWLIWSFWQAYQPQPVILQGQIEAQQYSISSKVPGRIAQVNVRKGDQVTVGQLIFSIDSPELEAKLEQALGGEQAAKAIANEAEAGARIQEIEAARDQWETAKVAEALTKTTFERMDILFNDGVIPEQQRDEVYAQLQVAQYTTQAAFQMYSMAKEGARSETIAAALGIVRSATGVVSEVEAIAQDITIRSNHNGEVETIFLREGELAPQGFPIVSIINIADVWAIFQVREDLLHELPLGSEISVRIPALGDDNFTFRISYISVMGNFATWRASNAAEGYDLRTFEVEARPVNPIANLRVGMTTLLNME